MSAPDPILAPATPPGFAPRAIVRLSGSGVFAFLRDWTVTSDRPLPDPLTRGIHAATGRVGGFPLPLLIAVFPGPNSFTGEDVAELLLPGNPHLMQRVIDELLARATASGVAMRRANPGEFSARAFLNDRMSLEQAEGVAALIAAETVEEMDAAQRLLRGERGDQYRALADEAATLLALVEAGIDFTDQEDVVAIAPADLRQRLAGLIRAIDSITGAAAGEEADRSLPRVVLAGKPNAGKSTLFNALLGRQRAVVSPIAGTTRDVLEEELALADAHALLCDCAGIEEAAALGVVAASMQARTRNAIADADLVLWCDPSGRFDPGDLPESRARVIRVRTKADMAHAPQAAGGDRTIEVSALDGFNLGALRRAIADQALGGSRTTRSLPARHRRALASAAAWLRRAAEAAGGDRLRHPEVIASHLRSGLDALGELTGRLTPDDVLGRVFATFCVGK
ncbi:MAG TPA: GTPase [Phycisphaerales bacterium]